MFSAHLLPKFEGAAVPAGPELHKLESASFSFIRLPGMLDEKGFSNQELNKAVAAANLQLQPRLLIFQEVIMWHALTDT